MATMGKYCKAYLVKDFRKYPAWTEKLENLRKVIQDGDKEGQVAERTLKDDDPLFLQENFVVTDGIFLDENIIFDAITPEWTRFCVEDLEFTVPSFDAEESVAQPGMAAQAAT